MKQLLLRFCALIVLAIATGCAHQITMAPNLNDVALPANSKALKQNVGYFISPTDLAIQAITPGGGGDKVSYFPYKDFEPGLYKALSEIFPKVTKLKAFDDAATIKQDQLNLLIKPVLTTTSSSSSMMTWPPTQFSVGLVCTITNPDGTPVTTIRVLGIGKAEFDEFRKDFSLAAKRASDDALKQLMTELLSNPSLNK